jgi:hypothetical protein
VYDEKILGLTAQGVRHTQITLRDILKEEDLSLGNEGLKLTGVASLLGAIATLSFIVMLFFITRYLNGDASLLTIIQIGLFSGFITSSVLFLSHSQHNLEYHFFLFSDLDEFPEDVAADLRQRFAQFENRTVRPLAVDVHPRYLSLIRGFFGIMMIPHMALLLFNTLLIIIVALLFGFFFQNSAFADALPWYRDLALGLSIAVVGLIVAYQVAFLVLQHLRLLMIPVVISLLTIALPYFFDYLFTGSLEIDEIKNAILGIGASVVTGVVAVVTSQVKEAMQEKEQPASVGEAE